MPRAIQLKPVPHLDIEKCKNHFMLERNVVSNARCCCCTCNMKKPERTNFVPDHPLKSILPFLSCTKALFVMLGYYSGFTCSLTPLPSKWSSLSSLIHGTPDFRFLTMAHNFVATSFNSLSRIIKLIILVNRNTKGNKNCLMVNTSNYWRPLMLVTWHHKMANGGWPNWPNRSSMDSTTATSSQIWQVA